MIVALLGVTLADNTPGYGAPAQTYKQPQQQQHQQQHHQPSHNTPPKYNYNYDVHGYGDHEPQFNAQEARDGYATQGSYSAKLPDGRTQTVTYRVDDAYSGFVADVKYEGEAKYPSYQSQQSYQPKQQSYQPKQTYKPQQQSYQPKQIYKPQQQSYQPKQSYKPQQQSYQPQQQQSYQPRQQSYQPRQQSYQKQQSYQPQQGYSA